MCKDIFNRPVKRLSKSTKPPAIIPKIKGMDCVEISKPDAERCDIHCNKNRY